MAYNFFNSTDKKDHSVLSEFKDEQIKNSNQEIGLRISDAGYLNIFNIRGNQKSNIFRMTINNIFNVEQPLKTGFFSKTKDISLLNIGPDELLLISETENIKENIKKFKDKMFKINACITDVSDHYQCLHLSGEKVRWILSKGCPVDLDENVFIPSKCAQTLIGNSNIILFCTQRNSFSLICNSSFANYILLWLKDASFEHGYEYMS